MEDLELLADKSAVLARWRGELLPRDVLYIEMRDELLRHIKEAETHERMAKSGEFKDSYEYAACLALSRALSYYRLGTGEKLEAVIVCGKYVQPALRMTQYDIGMLYTEMGGSVRSLALHAMLSYCVGNNIRWEELLRRSIDAAYEEEKSRIKKRCDEEGSRVCEKCGRTLPLSMFKGNGKTCSSCRVIKHSTWNCDKKIWNAEMMEKVRMLYPNMDTKKLAALLGVSASTLKVRTVYAGIKKSPEYLSKMRSAQAKLHNNKTKGVVWQSHLWTAEEVEYMRENYGKKSAKEVSEHLGIPITSVYSKRRWLRKKLGK